jgi:hypothetical protein
LAFDRQAEELKVFQSVLLAVLLATGALISDPPIVKAILLLLAMVVLLGGSAPGQHE